MQNLKYLFIKKFISYKKIKTIGKRKEKKKNV